MLLPIAAARKGAYDEWVRAKGGLVDRVPAIRRAMLADVAPLQALGWSALAVALPTALR